MDLIVGNWKMNRGGKDSLNLIEEILTMLEADPPGEVVVCPPATALHMVGERIAGTPVQLGCQNLFYEESGAYTGEIAPGFALDAGAGYSIIGHSERRHIFGEGPELNKKVKAALSAGITPILCVGETLEEREASKTWQVVKEQLKEGLKGIKEDELKGLVIAYEPVWAIGTGKSASPEDAADVARQVKKELSSIENLRILYGGSVKPENIKSFMSLPEIEGALVGGASLKAESFAKLIYWEK